MKDAILIVAVVSSAEPKAQDTGKSTGGIFSRAPSQAYSDGWERVYGKQKTGGLVVEDTKKDMN